MKRKFLMLLLTVLALIMSVCYAEDLPFEKDPFEHYELQEVGMTFKHSDENSKAYYQVISDNGVADTIKEGDLKGFLTFLKPGGATVDLYHPLNGKIMVSRFHYNIVPKGTFDPDCTIVFNYTNETRNPCGVHLVEFSQELNNACVIRAKELAINYSHTRPDGSSFVTVLTNRGNSLSENICVTTKPVSESEMPEYFQAWDAWNKNNESRANMINPTAREMGLNYYYDPVTQKRYWVQIFRG